MAGANTKRPSRSRCNPLQSGGAGTAGTGAGAALHDGAGAAAPQDGAGAAAPHEGAAGNGMVSEGGQGGAGGGAVNAGVGVHGTTCGGITSV